MNVFKKEILEIVTAAIFSLALLLPTTVKFVHTFEGHEHIACMDFSVHIHKKQLDCSICDFHFSIFDFKPQELPEFEILHGFRKTENAYLLPRFKKNTSHYFLRGPPLFS